MRRYGNTREFGYAAPVSAGVLATRAAHTIRPLEARDKVDLLDLLCGLDLLSRASRFCCAVNDARLAEHASLALSTAAFIAGAFVQGRLRGIVEVYDTNRAGVSEAAFVVAPDWRRRGLGFALLQAASLWARDSDRTALRLVFARSNWPMRQLAGKAGARFDLVLDDIEADVVIDGGCHGDHVE
jgi:GNAT superfamily N-acetyltransferase